jgi:hypothetical protein
MKNLFYIAVAGMLAVGTVGCGEKEASKDGEGQKGEKTEEAAKPEAAPAAAIVKDWDDRTLEVLEVQRGATLKYGKAEAGQEVVLVKVKVTNKAEKPLSANPMYFDIKDNGGGKAAPIRVYTVDGKYKLAKLQKGETNEGYVAFSANKGADLTLVYQLDALGKVKESIALK